MWWRKVTITLFLALTVGLNAAALGYAYADDQQRELLVAGLQLFFSLYVVVVAGLSVPQVYQSHSDSIIHLSGLTALASVLLLSVSILPDTPPPIIKTLMYEATLQIIWYSVLALYMIACVMSFTTPVSPALHFPPELVYSQKTVQTITNPDEANVCGLICTFLPRLTRTYH